MGLQTSDAAGSIVRGAVMPEPRSSVSLAELQAHDSAPRVESAVSGADRALQRR